MIIYDDKSDQCVARVVDVWKNISYYPGAVPASSLPKGLFNLTQSELQNKIWYVHGNKLYSEYRGLSFIYREQPNTILGVFGWMHVIFPFSPMVYLGYIINKLIIKRNVQAQ